MPLYGVDHHFAGLFEGFSFKGLLTKKSVLNSRPERRSPAPRMPAPGPVPRSG